MIKARFEEVIGQRLEPDRAVLACGVVESDRWCRRRLPHEPLGWHPPMLLTELIQADEGGQVRHAYPLYTLNCDEPVTLPRADWAAHRREPPGNR